VRRFLYGPPNWVVAHFNSEDRRMFGFWTFVISVATFPIFGGVVFYVSALSLLALIPNFSAETPVEVEAKDDQEDGSGASG